MAFDQKTRNLLQRTITACRRVFDREFTAQLQELYGIQPDGTLTQCEMLDHLADEELEIAHLLRSRLNHLEGGEPSEALTRTQAKPENVARVIREQAFTVLNRLAALRLCEERGLVLECVRKDVSSEGFQLFMTTAGNSLGETHEAYLVYLHCLFDELALDLGVLFDRFSPLALLFPRKDALEDVLRELNGTGKAAENEDISAEQFAEIWKADETIGWIYQYYNDEAERKKMRELSSAPRNSRELAVRNQFFTPRYVVEFLTDNTLGRLWYEMRHGETVLRDRCTFLVRRHTEIFLKVGESAPEGSAGNEASQEELLRQPVYIPHRVLKDPREIKLLDPACGSMHFGLYAFDLLTVIYDEAWEIALGTDDAAKSEATFAPFVTFAATFSDKAAFLLQVPRLIIEHNIHGIDIDPRAVQIAGLSLWLRAQRAWHEAGIRPADRPRITRSNIVCAEPMPGEKKLLREFVEQQFDIGERPAFAFLLEKIFDHMALAGEAGSLLRIEEEIRSAISEASILARSQPLPRQAPLFPGDEKPEPKQFELQGLGDEHFWQRAEQRIYGALEAYAERAENDGFQRRLFADDAAKGFAFIDLCRKRYDVVVMNPPFGEQTGGVKAYLANHYARTQNNLYCAFVERAYSLCPAGIVGLISARTFVMYHDFEVFRKEFLFGSARIGAFADLGWDVLDGAQVETAAFVLARRAAETRTGEELLGPFIRLLGVSVDEKEDVLLRVCSDARASKNVYFVGMGQCRSLPGSPLAYWASPKLVTLFSKSAKFEPSLAYCGRGAAAHAFFFRLAWEVPIEQSKATTWPRLAHGGEYSPFFRENSVVIYWKDDGREVKEYILKQYPYLNGNFGWAIQDEDKYGKVGLTSGKRNERFNVQLMPAGHIFTHEGQGFIPNRIEDVWFCLGYLNSSLVSYFLALTSGLQKTWVYIRPVPVVSLDLTVRHIVESAARHSFAIKQKWSFGAEEAALFICPWLLASTHKQSIRDGIKCLLQSHSGDSETLNHYRSSLSNAILKALELEASDEAEVLEDFERHPADVAFPPWRDKEDADILRESAARILSYLVGVIFGRWDIRYSTGERSAPELPDSFATLPICPPGMLQGDDGLPLSTEVGRRLRAEGLYPLDVDWDGILVDDPEHPLDLERHVRGALAVLWVERGRVLEHEACELLGVPTLCEWFRRPAGFFADHLKRYSKSRRQAPIYWPLSTASGRYTLWLYYHRLTPDTLYKCLQQFVVPKLADVEKELTHLRTVLAANEGGTKERNRLEELEGLRRELIELRTELVTWAPKWKPNLNDGVLITAAPLWKLFRLPKWQKDLKSCWQGLEKGDYDWAHLAYSLWPDRVREKCKTDRSLAIAHDLEDICEVKAPVKKVKKTKKTATKDDLQEFFEG